jgi:hypothetical protein
MSKNVNSITQTGMESGAEFVDSFRPGQSGITDALRPVVSAARSMKIIQPKDK